ncbi:PA14 domain-containing protein [Nocardia vaccinii]|uniref:PA14 domain-containing protein n=1 Tax=Nocardia vaccinii TaxID=1822 RepID=UPI00082E4E90|nr:PA14 domain-containing protein [Nocardia vaccinii]
MKPLEQRRVWSNTRTRFWLCAAAGVLALALTAQTVHVMVTPTAASKHVIDAARHLPLMKPQTKPAKIPAPNKRPPQPPKADFRPLGAMLARSGTHSGFNPKTSKEVSRSQKAVGYVNKDGSHSLVLSQTPVSVADGQGHWVPMDTRVVGGKSPKKANAARDGAHTEFAPFANDQALLQVNDSGAPVTFALKGAHKVARSVSGSTVTYANVLPGQDLKYEVEPGAVKESVILKSRAAVGDGRWVFEMKLGAGSTPQLRDNEVVITDSHGKEIAALPPIQVRDSAGEGKNNKKKKDARNSGKYELERKGDSWSLTVTVNKSWLTNKARVYPVVVDPTYTYGFGNTAATTAFSSDGTTACANTCGIEIGNSLPSGQDLFWRSGFRFDFSPLFGNTVVGARMDFQTTGTAATTAATANLYQATSPLGYGSLGPQLASAQVGNAGSMWSPNLTTYIAGRVAAQDNNAWFLLTGAETAGAQTLQTLQAQLIVDYGTAPPAATAVGPVDQAVVGTRTPTLSVNAVTNPSGDATLYCFKVSTGVDGLSGETADSGCLTTPTWTVPNYVLHDGATYTWTVLTALSGGVTTTAPPWVNHFKVDQRLGDGKISPTDRMGPVTVNLYNGNAYVEGGGPTFHSVGGDSGVKLAYNSLAGWGRGVTTSYFNDPTHTGTPAAVPVMVRTEPQVNLDVFGFFQPASNGYTVPGLTLAPALDPSWYVVRYEGYFQAPVAGDYRFDGSYADGMRLWVNNNLLINDPQGTRTSSDFTTVGPKTSQDITLAAGQRIPLKVELVHHTSGTQPKMVLWGRAATGPDTARTFTMNPQIVPTNLLYANDTAPLPGGWNLAVPGAKYMSATQMDGSVVLTEGTGTVHTWARTSEGGYIPPVGEDGVLAFDANGRITETEGGVASVFNPDGTLSTVTTVEDSKKPAALQYIYSGSPSRLTSIKDPVSGLSHTLYYNTDNSNNCYGGASAPAGAAQAPEQMLCRIKYWDGTETRLWYSTVRTLDRIENPGGEIRDFTYTDEASYASAIANNSDPVAVENYIASVGPLYQLRDPLASDWEATQTSYSGTADRTTILYDQFQRTPDLPTLAPTTINSPAPDGVTANTEPAHTYLYDPTHNSATVKIYEGPNSAYASYTSTYDSAGRSLTKTDPDGLVTSAEWTPKDKASGFTDAAGRRSTIVYDYADRPIDNYGPAPASCFTGQTPTAACAATVPHTHTNYDEGIAGLSASLYSNPVLSGIPAIWQTGVGSADGSLAQTWGSSPPVTNTGGWSARFTGEIQFSATGNYGLGFTAVDGVRLWIDDVRLVDSWTDKASTATAGTYNNTVAGSWHRIRVEYYNRSGTTGALNFTWTPPGAGSPATVPGQNLKPRYGSETSTVDDDTSGGSVERAPSSHTATSYSDPAHGIDPVYQLAVSTTNDPGGLALTTRSTFETPGNGYLRKTAQALPSGDVTNPDKRSTTTYYGDSETRANPCVSGSSAVNQAGLPKIVMAAKNSAGQANTAESVYDSSGRVVATRINTEPWSCVSYDARGRKISQSFPAQGTQPARNIAYDYAVGGNPLITKVTDESGSVTSTVDLDGQVVSYTDANGAVTATVYDTAGHVLSDTTTVKGVTSTLAYTWDQASRLLTVALDGTTVATPGYTNAGQIQNVLYGNGSRLDSITRNPAGAVTALAWKTANTTVADTVARSLANRITDENLTDSVGPATYTDAYTYDTVGRLVAATVPHHQLTYNFDATGGCGPNTAAGTDTNRTGFTDVRDTQPAVSTAYCYDNTDRLLSSTGANALTFGYDVYGNATSVGSDTLGYDSTRRHVQTTTAAGVNIQYTRDVSDRLTQRTTQGQQAPATNGTTRYGYTGASASTPQLTLDSTGNLLQRLLQLPGGVLLTKTYSPTATTNWSYPDVHGNIIFTADGTAARTGGIHLYDPYGQDIDPASGAFADIAIPATMTGGMDAGWQGQHVIPTEHLASQQALEMGARTYLPVLGRFLQTDPVAGGSANDYDYTNADPVNSTDLSGKFSISSAWNSAVDVTTEVAEVGMILPGPIGEASAAVATAGQLSQGHYADAAVDAVGMLPEGGLAVKGIQVGVKEGQAAEKAAQAAQKEGTCNSFTPSTLVLMADGTSKPINAITTNDQVLATDPATGTTKPEPVADVIVGHGTKHLVVLQFARGGGAAITATSAHPVWVKGRGWINAENLQAGDSPVGLPGTEPLSVASVADRGDVNNQSVYNLSVSQIHTFYVLAGSTAILVHNCDVHPSTPVGSRRSEMDTQKSNNTRGNIGGRDYTGHALDRTQGRGIPPSVVEDTIQHGIKSPGNQPGTTRYFSPENGVAVITNDRGDVITPMYASK